MHTFIHLYTYYHIYIYIYIYILSDHVKCYRDEILFNINPVGSFPGYAVVKDQPDPQCRSHPVPKQPVEGDNIPDTWSGHVLRLKYDSPVCGNTTLVEKVINYNV